MDRRIRIVLTNDDVKKLNKKERVRKRFSGVDIEIEALHPVEIVPVGQITPKEKDDLVKENERLQFNASLLRYRLNGIDDPQIQKYDDYIEIGFLLGRIWNVRKIENVELLYNQEGHLMGIRVRR